MGSPALSGFSDGWTAGWEREPDLTVDEWADRYRILPQSVSAEPGPWRTSRTPYLREIMECLSPSHRCEEVVFMKGTQIGATECGLNWLGYIMDYVPGPTLAVQPTVDMAKRWSKQRLAPLTEDTPRLKGKVKDHRSRDSGNTIMMKEFLGGILIITGANSATGLRSMPARYLFYDEVDAYPLDVDEEGNPIDLGDRRAATFARRKKYKCGTPTIAGISLIEQLFRASDRRRYHVPCPHCGHYDWIRWERVVKEPQPSLACTACGAIIEERHKPAMLAAGRWIAENPASSIAGFHLSALYSPLGWYSWKHAVSDYEQAKQAPSRLKTWTNTILGEPWTEQGEVTDYSAIQARCETYPAECPAGVCVLTMGVDKQRDRLEFEVVGWGPGEESWSIDYQILWGNTAQADVWAALGDWIREHTYEHETGAKLSIAAACIDSGDTPRAVYDFVAGLRRQHVYAIKGMGGARPIIEPALARARRLSRLKPGSRPEIIGVDEAKTVLYRRLREVLKPGPGYCHFPAGREEAYFRGLASEKLVLRYKHGRPVNEWVQIEDRNEALDARVYAHAALKLLNPDLSAIRIIHGSRSAPRGRRMISEGVRL